MNDAVIIHHIAKRAGISAVSAEKWAIASTAPSPAFCMPTSTDKVRVLLRSNRKSLPARYPPI